MRKALRQNRELLTTLGRAWPLIDPADLVGDLWSVPAYLRLCAPWLSRDEIQTLQRQDARAWTVADLPRCWTRPGSELGDPAAARRQRQRAVAIAAEREQMAKVVDNFIEVARTAGDEYGMGLVTMLRGEDFEEALIDHAALPTADPDLLAGPFAHIVVDEAQELTDAEWQMLLLRCPSRSFTIVGDRAQARHGFPETWAERLARLGFDQIRIATLSINYRTPEEVMAVAEPVIRAVLPDANVPTSIRSTGVPVGYGSATELNSIIGTWLAAPMPPRARGSPASSATPASGRRPRCLVADPRAGEGSRVRPGRPHRPGGVRRRHRGSRRSVCRDDQGDRTTRCSLTSAAGWKGTEQEPMLVAVTEARGQPERSEQPRLLERGDLGHPAALDPQHGEHERGVLGRARPLEVCHRASTAPLAVIGSSRHRPRSVHAVHRSASPTCGRPFHSPTLEMASRTSSLSTSMSAAGSACSCASMNRASSRRWCGSGAAGRRPVQPPAMPLLAQRAAGPAGARC